MGCLTVMRSIRFPLSSKSHPLREWRPIVVLISFAALAVFARFALLEHLPLPPCWLRKLTGIPCPSCGCTRSLASWATLDVEQAFRFNPLFFLLCVGFLMWSALWLVERFSGRRLLDDFKKRTEHWPWWKVGATLLVVNWLYLCLMLPK